RPPDFPAIGQLAQGPGEAGRGLPLLLAQPPTQAGPPCGRLGRLSVLHQDRPRQQPLRQAILLDVLQKDNRVFRLPFHHSPPRGLTVVSASSPGRSALISFSAQEPVRKTSAATGRYLSRPRGPCRSSRRYRPMYSVALSRASESGPVNSSITSARAGRRPSLS